MQHKPWAGFKLMMLQVRGMYWMRFVSLFPLSGQDVCRHGPLAGPLAVTDGEQDRPRGSDVRLRQCWEDLQHRQCCQDFFIVRSSLLSTFKGRWSHLCMHTYRTILKRDLSCVFMCLSSYMQRRYSEPNTYIDAPPSIPHDSDELYDDVASLADPEVYPWLKSTMKLPVTKIKTESMLIPVHLFSLAKSAGSHYIRVNHIKKDNMILAIYDQIEFIN